MRCPLWFLSGLALFIASTSVGWAVAPQPGPAGWVAAQIGLAVGLGVGVWALGRRWPWAAAWGLALAGAWVIPALTATLDWGRNTRGGLMAWLLPWAVAAGWGAWVGRRTQPAWRTATRIILAGAASAFMLASLLTSGSRGAIAALGLGALAGLVWTLWRRRADGRLFASAGRGTGAPPWAFRLTVISLPVALVAANLALVFAAGPIAERVNALDVGGADMGRLSIWRETWFLIGETPWTGSGLGSFEAVYARYARLIQVPLYTYAHQLYLGVTVQQGVLGGLGLWILFSGAWVAVLTADLDPARAADGRRPLRLAALTSIATLALHGLVDDPLYGNGGLPFLFVWAGAAAALGAGLTWRRPRWPRWAVMVGAIVGLVVSGLFIPVSALTNWGAVVEARAALAAWPDPVATAPAPLAARQALEAALVLNPGWRAANYRLGRWLLESGDYTLAETHLSQAYAAAPDSRATAKALGYALLWSGDVDAAENLLMSLPEIPAELDAYAFFWRIEGQPTLSEYAAELADRLR